MEQVPWLAAEEQRAWQTLQRMHLRLDGELASQLAADSGLSYQDYTVLVGLTGAEGGALRMFELGRSLGWEKSRLSHHVVRMVARGLVTKERCPTDGRGWSVVVTPLGRAEIEAAAPGHVKAVRRLFVDLLSPEQLDTIATVAEAVLTQLKNEDGDPDPDPDPDADAGQL